MSCVRKANLVMSAATFKGSNGGAKKNPILMSCARKANLVMVSLYRLNLANYIHNVSDCFIMVLHVHKQLTTHGAKNGAKTC